VLKKIDDTRLKAFVVWVPMSRGMERDVPQATLEVSDARAEHFWDEDGQLVKEDRDVLKMNEPAWDIYLLYGPDARWVDDRPPVPLYWMHQLGSKRRPRAPAPFWDPGTFLQRARDAAVTAPIS